MPAGVIAGERIRALAGDGVPGAVCWWPGRRACGLPGRARPADVRRSGVGLAGHGVPVVFETKIVTATAAVRLAERRVFDLDMPVFGHVPALRRVPGRTQPELRRWPQFSRARCRPRVFRAVIGQRQL